MKYIFSYFLLNSQNSNVTDGLLKYLNKNVNKLNDFMISSQIFQIKVLYLT